MTDKNQDTPYLNARREMGNMMWRLMSGERTWQVVAIAALLVALVAVAGVVHIGSQSKFVPYVVEVDKVGEVRAVQAADVTRPADPRVIHAYLAKWINDARMVTPDVEVQRGAIFRVYALLAPNDAATARVNEWYNRDEEASPFKRAEKETVAVEIASVIPQSEETWQVDWVETTRSRDGAIKGEPMRMRALITIYLVSPTPNTTEEDIRKNPLGIYIKEFSWSRQV
jgi:type IV secretion system protein VirB5